jgi:hypothetical protein
MANSTSNSPGPPECIEQASATKYNACRIYGRITAFGVTYIYIKDLDVLIRQDLYPAFKLLRKQGALDAFKQPD